MSVAPKSAQVIVSRLTKDWNTEVTKQINVELISMRQLVVVRSVEESEPEVAITRPKKKSSNSTCQVHVD